MATVIAQAAPVIAERAATIYTGLEEPQKQRVATGVNLLGRGLTTVSTIPFMIVSAIANFFILAFIFILTLFLRNRALFQAGDERRANYVRDSLLLGAGLALGATAVIFVIDLLSGGFASLVMIGVYIIAGVGTLILSLIRPSFLNDITETTEVNGEQTTVGRTSAYRNWSIAFWPTFAIGMLAALALGAATTYVSNKFSKNILDLLAGAVTSREGSAISRTMSLSRILGA